LENRRSGWRRDAGTPFVCSEQLWSWMPGRNHGDIQNGRVVPESLRAAGEAKDAGPAQEDSRATSGNIQAQSKCNPNESRSPHRRAAAQRSF
jgi:hypothetical protein